MKKWYQSKIVWAGAIAILSAVADVVMSNGSASWRQLAVAAFGALVIYLRTVTSTKIS